MDIIKVYIDVESRIFQDATAWCYENNIILVGHKMLHSENAFGRATIYGFDFFFKYEADAMALKLRWE